MRQIRVVKYWVVALLVALSASGALWAVLAGRPAPLLAAGAYAMVALLVLLREEFGAAVAVGAIGSVLHLAELLGGAAARLGGAERILFLVNTLLPLAVVWLGWRALSGRHEDEEIQDTRPT